MHQTPKSPLLIFINGYMLVGVVSNASLLVWSVCSSCSIYIFLHYVFCVLVIFNGIVIFHGVAVP